MRSVIGIDNGELRPSWKTALDATNPATLTAAGAAAAGTSLIFAHRDHVHAITSSSNPGAAASLLASTAAGLLTLVGLTTIGGNVRIDSNNQAAGTLSTLWLTHVGSSTTQLKNAIVSEAINLWGKGKIHILQNTVSDGSNATVANAIVTIDSGKVGILTPSPNGVLDVYQGTIESRFSRNTTQYLAITTNSTANWIQSFSTSASEKPLIISNEANVANAYLVLRTAATERLRITYDGNVGIGMTPTYKLDVTGNARISTGFGCNGTTPQTALASGGAVTPGAGAFGFDSAVHAAAVATLVTNMRAALVANGIMS